MGYEPSAAASALVQTTLLGELLEHARIGALAIDEGHYVAANGYACELTGYPRDQLIGRRVGELNPLSALPAQLAEAMSGRRESGEMTIRRLDGSEVRVCYRLVGSQLAGLTITLGLFWPV